MKNGAFVLWLIGHSLVKIIYDYANYSMGITHSDGVQLAADVTGIIVFIAIAWLLYEKG